MGKIQFSANLYRFPPLGEDFEGLWAFVRTAEVLGFGYLRLLDHIVGITTDRLRGAPQTPYTAQSHLHEVFTLMAYLASITKSIGLVTGVLALPQRETVLVAKQAAEIDILSQGRMTLGVGIGYNPIEFQAVGASFPDRAQRLEEQITVLRKLWTEEVVDFEGKYHNFAGVSLAPRPIQRPIPIFIGAGRAIAPVPPDVALDRVGRLADGWPALIQPNAEGKHAWEKVRSAARRAGRNADDIMLELDIMPAGKSRTQLVDEVKARVDLGARRINVATEGNSAAEQIEELKRFRDVMDAF